MQDGATREQAALAAREAGPDFDLSGVLTKQASALPAGETVEDIADVRGVHPLEIYAANPELDPSRMWVGQVLLVPVR